MRGPGLARRAGGDGRFAGWCSGIRCGSGPSDLAFAGAAAQARMLADGEVTAPLLLEVYLERIERLDSELRATGWCATTPRARRPRSPNSASTPGKLPLLGVPIAIKDDVDVAGEVTTYGSGGMARRRLRRGNGAALRAAVRSSSARPMCPS
ncbi:amidase family protein [Mycobacterium ulcerans str. Harvey]|uniref:Amidase family protein n=1 Tax=Mycobacterium ulcerans str. Harvey TaxID=1299332 RepID=A0ABN0QNI1_MYCUL|nr:amidase family protein [Mycobacterium ulcerans str. Harvey]